MVTLLGFFFIVANVICLEIFVPDLVGPVGPQPFPFFQIQSLWSCLPRMLNQCPRVRHGYIIALRLGYGCERRPGRRSSRNQLLILFWEEVGTQPWITLMASKHGEQRNPAG